jgi:transcriptional regulator GlxA family with amidase domain
MENQAEYIQTSAVGMAAFDLVITLIFLLVGKGVFTWEEVKELIGDKVYQTGRLQNLPVNPAELSPAEVKRVLKVLLNTLEKFEADNVSEASTKKFPQ